MTRFMAIKRGADGFYGVHRLDGPGLRRGDKVFLPAPGLPEWPTLGEAIEAARTAGYSTESRDALARRYQVDGGAA